MTEGGRNFLATIGGTTRRVGVEFLGGNRFAVTVDGRRHEVECIRIHPHTLDLRLHGVRQPVRVGLNGMRCVVGYAGRVENVRLQDPRVTGARPGTAVRALEPVRAAMPGRIVAVLVAPGVTVTAGQGIVIVEAMKMENALGAPRAGTVREVRVQPGQAVEAGEILAILS